MYSNCCCSCSFEPEIIKIGQSSHKMYSNNILNFQESTAILNACTKSLETYLIHLVYIIQIHTYINSYIYMYAHIFTYTLKSKAFEFSTRAFIPFKPLNRPGKGISSSSLSFSEKFTLEYILLLCIFYENWMYLAF